MSWVGSLPKGEGVGEVNPAIFFSLLLYYHVYLFHSSSTSNSALLLFHLAAAAYLQGKGSGPILISYANSVSVHNSFLLPLQATGAASEGGG